MIKKGCVSLLFLVLVGIANLAGAADVSGKWRAEFTTPDGTQRVNTFTLKADRTSYKENVNHPINHPYKVIASIVADRYMLSLAFHRTNR